ncbi:MAG: metallophosphoesterase [Promethearchaeota archaeon]|nr:MAG: metallophosphoesterase [Candidatus Lokiarchaeota archaeon]
MGVTNPKILVVSDNHLGSLDSEKDLFIQFLRKINNGEFGNELQALIILGDFIDLCTDIPETLLKREKIQEILTLLIQIKNKLSIILLLGNHEVPVTGDYDEKFQRRKEKFLIKFENSNISELFDNGSIGQYIILKKWNNEDMLLLYDSRNQIEKNPINKVRIEGLDLDSNYMCLMTHGYQFESDIYRFFVGQVWKSMISSNNFEIKETFDYFWNEIIKNGRKIKPITFGQMKQELATLKNMPIESIDALFSELTNLEFKLIKANARIMKKWERAKKLDYYLEEIQEFLEDDIFSKVNHLIYGHSHNKGVYNGTINGHPIEIVNDGSWQHIKPSYVEIHYKGILNLRTVLSNVNS